MGGEVGVWVAPPSPQGNTAADAKKEECGAGHPAPPTHLSHYPAPTASPPYPHLVQSNFMHTHLSSATLLQYFTLLFSLLNLLLRFTLQ